MRFVLTLMGKAVSQHAAEIFLRHYVTESQIMLASCMRNYRPS